MQGDYGPIQYHASGKEWLHGPLTEPEHMKISKIGQYSAASVGARPLHSRKCSIIDNWNALNFSTPHTCMMIPTGLDKLDVFLSGGVPKGAVTDIFGPNGTGKTQLLFQLAAGAVRRGGSVLYVDTSGGFRPERIIQILKRNDPGLLEQISILRVRNTHEQISSMRAMRDSDYDLILVDNVTDLFSFEYHGMQTFEKNLPFMGYMRGLSMHAVSSGVPVVLTNMVRQTASKEVENMHSVVDPFTHVKIRLFRSDGRLSGRAEWMQHSLEFAYRISLEGVAPR